MSSKFDTIFLERYIKNECTDAEREAFDSALRDSPSLRSSFDQMKKYAALINLLPEEKTSEAFTDNVMRTIRLKKEKPQLAIFPAIRGLFTREVLGVLTAVVVLALIFSPQLRSVSGSFETAVMDEVAPSVAMKSEVSKISSDPESPVLQSVPSKSSADRLQSTPKGLAYSTEANTHSAPAEINRQTSEADAPQAAMNELASAPSPIISTAEEKPEQIALMGTIRNVTEGEYSTKKGISPTAPSMKDDALQSKSKSMKLEESFDATPADFETKEERSEQQPFPYSRYKAHVTGTDTLLVRLPENQLSAFIAAWKKSGGTVISTDIEDTLAIVRAKGP